ncbi:MAG: hypothetical protein RLZZ618_2151 [Pseudomonadota bacterium]
MLDRKISVPAGYEVRGCVLVSYRLPLLRHCFVLCSESGGNQDHKEQVALMAFFLTEAARLADESVGDHQAFMLIHSGRSIRKRSSWHLHVFVVTNRWQKASVYAVLAIKNFSLAVYRAVIGRTWSKAIPNPPHER